MHPMYSPARGHRLGRHQIGALIVALVSLASACSATGTVTAPGLAATEPTQPAGTDPDSAGDAGSAEDASARVSGESTESGEAASGESTESGESASDESAGSGDAPASQPTQPTPVDQPDSPDKQADESVHPALRFSPEMANGTVFGAPAQLPPTHSPIVSVGDYAAYYSAAASEMYLTVFNAKSGEALYQLQAHPLGRIRGVGQDIVASESNGLVYLTGISDPADTATAFVAAHEIATGQRVWQQSIPYGAAQPFLCGHDICVRSEQTQLVIDGRTGSVVRSFEVSDRRLAVANDTVWIATTADRLGRFNGLEATHPATDQTIWTLTADHLASHGGLAVDPDYGWAGQHDTESGASIVHIATPSSAAIISFGISAEGVVMWTRDDLETCVRGPVEPDTPILCTVDLSTNLFSAMVRLDMSNGEPVWSVPLEQTHEEFAFDGRNVTSWLWNGADYEVELIDATSGAVSDINTNAALCLVAADKALFVYADGVEAEWRSAPNHALCGSDGLYLPRDQAKAATAHLSSATGPWWLIDEHGLPLAAID